MGVRDEVLQMVLEEKMSPPEIASYRGVTLKTIFGYLDQMIGDGRLRPTDILLTLSVDIRQPIIEEIDRGYSHSTFVVKKRLKRKGYDIEANDILVVQRYGHPSRALGDMYADLRTIEVGLHSLIKDALEAEFGPDETGWWRQGIPAKIRGSCQTRREDDLEPAPIPYCYTDLIDLKEIIDKNWGILSQHFPKETASNKKALMTDLEQLNRLRRIVMHPVRGGRPTDDDFEFVYTLKLRLGFS